MDRPAQRPFEILDRAHAHGVDHLLPERRVAIRCRQSILCEQVGAIEVDGRVHELAVFVNVDDVNIFAARPWLEILPWNPKPYFVEKRRFEARGHSGIDCKHSEVSKHRLGDYHPARARPTSIAARLWLVLRGRGFAFGDGWPSVGVSR